MTTKSTNPTPSEQLKEIHDAYQQGYDNPQKGTYVLVHECGRCHAENLMRAFSIGQEDAKAGRPIRIRASKAAQDLWRIL